MRVVATSLPEVLLIELDVFEDARGHFYERFNERAFGSAGLPVRFVQDNHSYSRAGVLRGLHFQQRNPQGKLIQCTRGAVWDVAVDVREGSPTFGKWVGVELSADVRQLLWIPPGFAHGFCVTATEAELTYKCTEFFDSQDDAGVAWNDPTLGVPWPVKDPILSDKDRQLPPLEAARLPRYRAR